MTTPGHHDRPGPGRPEEPAGPEGSGLSARRLVSASRRLGDDVAPVVGQVRSVGLVAWTSIGVAIVAAGVVTALAAVSELVLPLVFAVILGVVVHPLARWLQARGLPPAAAAATVVVAIVVGVAAVIMVVVLAVVDQAGAIGQEIDLAVDELAGSTEGAGLDDEALADLRTSVESVAAVIGRGLLTAVVGGLNAVVGFVGGTVLGLLLLYYVLKDGPAIRSRMVATVPGRHRAEAAEFTAGAIRSLRAYWAGRSVLSAAVTAVVVVASLIMGLPLVATIAVVNFIGGFVPYLGAFLGGGLATLVALAHHGLGGAAAILVVTVVANVGFENLLEPRVMSGRLKIHPLLVLIATTTGGVLGGIVGLILAVPLTVIGLDLAGRLGRLAREARTDPVRDEGAVDPGTSPLSGEA